MNDLCGVVFLDKPKGWSSRRAINEVVKRLRPEGGKKLKAGHTGTLDPLATGMLPILIGDATRFAEMGLDADKAYRVSFDLSYQTETLDCEGVDVIRFDGHVTAAELDAALKRFSGEIEQVPPQYSAIRIDGKRAHAMARKGEVVQMQARAVTIHELKLLDFDFPVVTLDVRCSKGTYIRSLARDIGESLGLGGCVTDLRRLSTGGWPEQLMVSIEQLDAEREACLLPLAHWLRHLPGRQLDEQDARRFLQGQRIQLRDTGASEKEIEITVLEGEMVLGTARLQAGLKHMVLHPTRILPSAQKRYL